MVAIGVLFLLKNMIAIWGQDSPTFLVPGNPIMFAFLYLFGYPSIFWMLCGCPANGEIAFPYRDIVGFVMYMFGLTYSFAYEYGRFQWKKHPENKGRCHTVGLASLCIHPNYFGDLFTFSGWAIAGGSICGLCFPAFQLGCFLWIIIPNSDAYLAQRYSADFPQYALKTAPLIPFVISPLVNQVIALAGFVGSVVAGTYCTMSCGADS